MFKLSEVSRMSAFFSHLVFSLIILLVLSYLIYFHWFPGFLFWTDGGIEGLRLIAGIDIILGPILTFIIFKPGKIGLAKDVAIITFIQITCLLIGILLVYASKTEAILYSQGAFFTIDAHEVRLKPDLAEKLNQMPGNTPKMVYVLNSREVDPKDKIGMDKNGNIVFDRDRPELFRNFYENLDKLPIENAYQTPPWTEINQLTHPPHWLTTANTDKQKYQSFRLIAKYALNGYFAIMHRETGEIIDYWPRKALKDFF